jgi:hypothetical protein
MTSLKFLKFSIKEIQNFAEADCSCTNTNLIYNINGIAKTKNPSFSTWVSCIFAMNKFTVW